jgi:hypothetical protein
MYHNVKKKSSDEVSRLILEEQENFIYTNHSLYMTLEHVLSLINIDGVEEWKVDMADDYLSDRPDDTITNPLLPTDTSGRYRHISTYTYHLNRYRTHHLRY